MAPPSSSTARRAATARPQQEAGRNATRRPPLRVVPAETRRRRLLRYMPVAMIVAALLVVVAGQAMLANGQVRMAGIQKQLTVEQGVHRQEELLVSKLETPSRIVGSATGQLHMVHPDHVTQLPYVSLTTPLPTPKVTPAPVSPAPSSTQTASQ